MDEGLEYDLLKGKFRYFCTCLPLPPRPLLQLLCFEDFVSARSGSTEPGRAHKEREEHSTGLLVELNMNHKDNKDSFKMS